MKGRIRWAAAALTLAAWSTACGADDPLSRASGPRMQAAADLQQRPATDPAAGNRAPRIDAVRFDPAQPGAGVPIRALVESSDPDGDPLSHRFEWTVGGSRIAARGPQLVYWRSRKGEAIEVSVTASDGHAESAPFHASLRIANHPPDLAGIRLEPAGAISSGNEITVRPTAVDPDGDPISFLYTWWVNGSTVDEDGPVFDTLGLRRGDRVRVRVVATDGQDTSERVESLEVTLANAAPTIVSEPGAAGKDGVFRYRVRADDPDGDRTLRYSLLAAPEGMTVTRRRGEIAWKPRADQVGTHHVELAVEDLQGGRAVQSFQVVVGSGEAALEGEGVPPPPAREPARLDDEAEALAG